MHGGPSHGFTLIELLIAAIILGILSFTAFPTFLNQQGRARISAAQNASMAAARACAAAITTGDVYTAPSGITSTSCAAGAQFTFTASNSSFGTTTAAVSTLRSSGDIELTTCASANGWTAGTPSSLCTPNRIQ
ncbi:MAG: type II secretion system protein [Cyanobacteria bacterium M_surface_10_m2_119]|nr:type II secretion system protein [Cyanobacteria bacterium M_surface_10_m2_119]